MLKTRIVTAAFLFSAFFLALFFLPPVGWALFVTLVAAIAAWEWGALMGLPNPLRVLMGIGGAVVCILVVTLMPVSLGIDAWDPGAAKELGAWLYVPAIAFWLLGAPLWFRYRWRLHKNVLGVVIGALVILPTWLALVQLRMAGPLFLLSIMAIVWLADIGAYAFGRTLGRHKLAPSISPGKTWEGALGGAAVVLVYGMLVLNQFPLAFARNNGLLLVALVFLTIISVVGDLFESLLKRQVGLKDSSSILPGHGGVLDRIDSLTSTLPLVALVWLISQY